MNNNYVIEYLCENEYHKRCRAIKKYNMLAYKKLLFEFLPALKDGNFLGVVTAHDEVNSITKYDLKLPADTTFNKVHGDIVLHYSVYDKQKVVMLENLTPDDILTEGHQEELHTYKGVMVSKTHASKDIFKINLINLMDK